MRIPLLSGKQILSTLKRIGFVEVHRKGSHVKMKHFDGRVIVFPYHKEVDRYTLKGALIDALNLLMETNRENVEKDHKGKKVTRENLVLA